MTLQSGQSNVGSKAINKSVNEVFGASMYPGLVNEQIIMRTKVAAKRAISTKAKAFIIPKTIK